MASVSRLSKDEREKVLIKHLNDWHTKLGDELSKDELPKNLNLIVQYSSGVWQHAKALQKHYRKEENIDEEISEERRNEYSK